MTEEEKKDSLELLDFIMERHQTLESPETRYATDIHEHPQINHVIFHADSSTYEMWDRDGTYFTFTALTYSVDVEMRLGEEIKKMYKRKSKDNNIL